MLFIENGNVKFLHRQTELSDHLLKTWSENRTLYPHSSYQRTCTEANILVESFSSISRENLNIL